MESLDIVVPYRECHRQRTRPPKNKIQTPRNTTLGCLIKRCHQSHQNTLAVPRRLGRILRFLDLADHEIERLCNVIVQPGTGLGEAAVELLTELAAFL